MSTAENQLAGRLLELCPFETESQALLALRATLSALGSSLTSDEAKAVADDLGAEWAQPLRTALYVRDLPLEEFYRLAALQEGERLAVATEHAQVVCRALSELLSESTREQLRRHVPQLAELFSPPKHEVSPTPLHQRPPSPEEHTLSSGRSGSRHPVSDAKPEAAHSQSIARSDDPHADTKLSSTTGLKR